MNKIMSVNYIHKQRKVCELKHDHDYVYEYNEIIMSYQVYELTHKHELDHGTNEHDYDLLHEYNHVYGTSEHFYELAHEFV